MKSKKTKIKDIRIKEYRQTVNRCMATMMSLFGLIYVFALVEYILTAEVFFFLDGTASEVVNSLISSFCYMSMFILPIFTFRAFSRKALYFPLAAKPTLPKGAVRICIAAVSVVFPTTIINSLIMGYLAELTGRTPDFSLFESEINGIHSIVLMFISTAIVPALCEEFLFRGVIQKNLMPYGKTVSVVISAFLFALMHQNFYQFLYTFVAGLVLGYVFLMTGSIWCGVLIHFINNFISVFLSALSYYLNDEAAALAEYLIMSVFLLCGILSIVSLLKDMKKNETRKMGSVYMNTEPLLVFDSDRKLTCREATKHFFTPSTVCVILFSVASAFMTLALILIPA